MRRLTYRTRSHWSVMTEVTLNLLDLVTIHVANLALTVVVEYVAAIEDVVDHEAIRVVTVLHPAHALVMIVDNYNLCARIVTHVAVVVNCGICLTENCCSAEDHHSDYHHAEILCCHCFCVFVSQSDSGYTCCLFFWVQRYGNILTLQSSFP